MLIARPIIVATALALSASSAFAECCVRRQGAFFLKNTNTPQAATGAWYLKNSNAGGAGNHFGGRGLDIARIDGEISPASKPKRPGSRGLLRSPQGGTSPKPGAHRRAK